MRGVLLVLCCAVLAGGLAGCVGDGEVAPAEETSPPAERAANETVPTTEPRTALTGCPPGLTSIPCFEPSVAADPAGRVYVANAVCDGIARSAPGNASFEELDRPPLPPVAPPTTTVPGDCTLDVGPEGDLYFSAYHFQDTVVHDPAVPNHYGIQVARSENGGDSWTTNTYLSPTTDPPTPALHPDRQWLAFGADGRVYLTFWGAELDRSWVAVSEDRAASFGPFRPMPATLPGQPIAQGAETLHVPWLDASDDAVRVSTSTDGGESFRTRTVGEVGLTFWWPDLAEGPDGRLYLAWLDGDRVLVARETGDGAWTDPLLWNEGPRNATGVAPGIAVHGGTVDVVWYGHRDGERAHVVGRAPAGTWNGTSIETQVLGTYQADRTVSHFADTAVDPDGQAVFAWTDPAAGILVARETGRNATAGSTPAEGPS